MGPTGYLGHWHGINHFYPLPSLPAHGGSVSGRERVCGLGPTWCRGAQPGIKDHLSPPCLPNLRAPWAKGFGLPPLRQYVHGDLGEIRPIAGRGTRLPISSPLIWALLEEGCYGSKDYCDFYHAHYRFTFTLSSHLPKQVRNPHLEVVLVAHGGTKRFVLEFIVRFFSSI